MLSTRRCSIKCWVIVVILIFQGNVVWGQNNRVENFIKAGPADAEILTKGYLKPYSTGIGGTLNTGWFHSASPNKLFEFDLQVRGALAIVPSSGRRYFVDENNFEKIRLVEGESAFSPTGAGHTDKGPRVIIQDDGDEIGWFDLPQGSGFGYAPAPLIQASVGLIKNTDLTLRFIPKIGMGEYIDYNMKGVGVKHLVNQWLPNSNQFPLDISVFAGYNHVDITGKFDMDPPEPDPATNYDNQRVLIDFDTFAAKLIMGKDLKLVSLFGAFGYETSTMDLAVKGNYPIPANGPGGTTVTETLTDPFSYSQNGKNKYSATAGVTFKLSFVRIYGEFTAARYPVANAGIGFSLR